MINDNKTFISLIVAVLVLAIMTIGITYAVFSIGNGTSTGSVVSSTGNLDIEFTTSDTINNPQLVLVPDSESATDSEKIIATIGHLPTSNIKAQYFVAMTELTISDNFKSSDFKWELLIDNTVISSGNFQNAVTGQDYIFNETAKLLEIGDTDNLELRVWLSESNVDQSNLYNGSFSGKLEVKVYR